MGRHRADSFEPTGPQRDEPPTSPIQLETNRRVWPVALLFTLTLSAAVGVPAFLAAQDSDTLPTGSGSTVPRTSATADVRASEPEPAPRAAPTVTKTVKVPGPTITKKAAVGPTVRPTVYVTRYIQGPLRTITKTVRPVPGPTVTKTITNEVEVRTCFAVRQGIITREIQCP